jgi:hypothetical protein
VQLEEVQLDVVDLDIAFLAGANGVFGDSCRQTGRQRLEAASTRRGLFAGHLDAVTGENGTDRANSVDQVDCAFALRFDIDQH